MVATNLLPFFWAVMLSTVSGAWAARSFDQLRAAASAALAVSPWNRLATLLVVIVPPQAEEGSISTPIAIGPHQVIAGVARWRRLRPGCHIVRAAPAHRTRSASGARPAACLRGSAGTSREPQR